MLDFRTSRAFARPCPAWFPRFPKPLKKSVRTASNPIAGPKGPLYADTSALFKLYFPEPRGDAVNQTLLGRRDVVISELTVTEMVSALARRRREGVLHADVARKVYRTVLRHIEEGIYRCLELSAQTHREAERLLLVTEAVPLRAADALHLALAGSVRAKSLLTFDQRMAGAARAAGFVTIPNSL